MNKNDFFTNKENSLETAAEFVWTAEKTEALINTLAGDAYFGKVDEADVAWLIAKTGVFDFSLDDVRFWHDWQRDEYAQDTQRTINYLLKTMTNIPAEDRLVFFNQNIAPNVSDRDSYWKALKCQMKNLNYYA